jgi:hypothetical protein
MSGASTRPPLVSPHPLFAENASIATTAASPDKPKVEAISGGPRKDPITRKSARDEHLYSARFECANILCRNTIVCDESIDIVE